MSKIYFLNLFSLKSVVVFCYYVEILIVSRIEKYLLYVCLGDELIIAIV